MDAGCKHQWLHHSRHNPHMANNIREIVFSFFFLKKKQTCKTSNPCCLKFTLLSTGKKYWALNKVQCSVVLICCIWFRPFGAGTCGFRAVSDSTEETCLTFVCLASVFSLTDVCPTYSYNQHHVRNNQENSLCFVCIMQKRSCSVQGRAWALHFKLYGLCNKSISSRSEWRANLTEPHLRHLSPGLVAAARTFTNAPSQGPPPLVIFLSCCLVSTVHWPRTVCFCAVLR